MMPPGLPYGDLSQVRRVEWEQEVQMLRLERTGRAALTPKAPRSQSRLLRWIALRPARST